MNNTAVDVIIPVYKPDGKLEKLIDRLNNQSVTPGKIIFMQTMLDDEENDRVKSILVKANNSEIHPVEAIDFDHGGTRNKGASLSSADYMLFMTQDAVPVDNYLVEKLLASFEKDSEVAVAYGRQIAGDDVGVIENYTREFNYPDRSIIKSAEDIETLGIKTFFCSNVCAMYKKAIYEQLGGFVTQTIFNEDMIMAASVIDNGFKIAYAADAVVVHAHKYTYRQQLSRNFDMAVSQEQYHEIFDRVKSESEGIKLVKDTSGYLVRTGRWYMVPDLIMQSGFKFIGYKLGRKYEKLPRKIVQKISMNKRYWKEREDV
ncbi:glycosyltransferase [Eubacterium xylanophilum]|uniref:glycosyltransferase n=1 Tax=Eubacterium xylanophilum TaxID=39497 RepID=UPI00047E0D45|nr:glycosyltransferase family 2 protein [Eubacterium xylanophilum]